MKRFKSLLLEFFDLPLTEVDSGVVPQNAPREGYTQRLFHAPLPDDRGNGTNANLWLTWLTDPTGKEHEVHFTTSRDVNLDSYRRTRENLDRTYGDQFPITPVHVMGASGLLEQPHDVSFGPSTMYHIFHHIKSVADQAPPGAIIHFDSRMPGEGQESRRRSSIYRRYLERFIEQGLGDALPTDDPDHIKVVKFK